MTAKNYRYMIYTQADTIYMDHLHYAEVLTTWYITPWRSHLYVNPGMSIIADALVLWNNYISASVMLLRIMGITQRYIRSDMP